MKKHRSRVTLITDLEEAAQEFDLRPVWMVQPRYASTYTSQRMSSRVALVNLATVNLAKMKTFETL